MGITFLLIGSGLAYIRLLDSYWDSIRHKRLNLLKIWLFLGILSLFCLKEAFRNCIFISQEAAFRISIGFCKKLQKFGQKAFACCLHTFFGQQERRLPAVQFGKSIFGEVKHRNCLFRSI